MNSVATWSEQSVSTKLKEWRVLQLRSRQVNVNLFQDQVLAHRLTHEDCEMLLRAAWATKASEHLYFFMTEDGTENTARWQLCCRSIEANVQHRKYPEEFLIEIEAGMVAKEQDTTDTRVEVKLSFSLEAYAR